MSATSQDELDRARLWREQVNRRVEFQGRLWASLSGDPDAYARLLAAWAPLMGVTLGEEIDPQDDPGFDPYGISDTVNVGI
jgi:hypothetical protein